jgi:hypothetical protein
MPAEVRIQQTPKGLRISVTSHQSPIQSVLLCVATTFIFGTAAKWLLPWPWWMVGLVFGVLCALLISRLDRRSELNAVNLDFSTTCTEAQTGRRQPWVVARADIQSMYFDKEHGGDDEDYYPEGLYADTFHGEACILPYIDERQSIQVISEIYKRFPDMPLVKQKSPFERNFTILDLKS